MSIFLSPLLANSLPSGSTPQLVVITDSFLQPGLTLFREFIATTIERDEAVILIAMQQPSKRLLPSAYDSTNIDIIDCTTSTPHATTSNSHHVDLRSTNAVPSLERTIRELIEARRRKLGPNGGITVLLDSVDELAERGVHGVVRILSGVLRSLGDGKNNSRVVLLHHAAYPSPPTTIATPQIAPSLLATLLSPTLSPSTIHLILHPAPLIELLSREYGLAIPLSTSAASQTDIRLTSFLQSFTNRHWGNPFDRPKTSAEEDERIGIDLGGEVGGGHVVEWTARGVNLGNSGGGGGGKAVKKIVQRGLEGVRRRNGGRVEIVPLREVVRFEKMAQISLPLALTDSSNPTSAPKKPLEPLLPFNLSLTDTQKAAREEVVLPYLPKEDGSVEYVPDEGDDVDDDDPDEDLEI